jgi:ATP synthase protein I
MSIITPVSRSSKLTTRPPAHPYGDEDSGELEFKPLTAQEAQDLRKRNPALSPWVVVAWQALVGLVTALAAWGFTGKPSTGISAGYGALVVVVPAMLFARGLTGQFSSPNTASAGALGGMGFFVWEAVKIAVSIAMLFAASRWVADLDWLALLIGLILTMKVYWVALLMRPKAK